MAYQRATTSSSSNYNNNSLNLRDKSSALESGLLGVSTGSSSSTGSAVLLTGSQHLSGKMALVDEATFIANKDKLTSQSDLNIYHNRPLHIFCYDITQLSPVVKSVVLIGGLIVFMCLYGYYQELVVYGWFNRKLSIFSTFLHFLGCSIFAQIQRNMSRSQHSHHPVGSPHPASTASSAAVSPNGSNAASTTHTSLLPIRTYIRSLFTFHMGTATPRTAFFYYALLVLLKTGAQGLSNLSMTQINYPAKVLFKSANPVITMIIGVCWFRKSYPLRDYIVVLLLIIGLYIFVLSDMNDGEHHNTESPHGTFIGICYVSLSMFAGASIPMIQEYCMTSYHASVEDLLYFSFLGSTLVSFFISFSTGEFMEGMYFLLTSGSMHTTFIFVAFCTFGFFGANFSTAITSQYGALVNGISNTFRKAVTIGLSFFLFPERNHLTSNKLIGVVVFFAGLLIRIFSKAQHGHAPLSSASSSMKQHDEDNDNVSNKEKIEDSFGFSEKVNNDSREEVNTDVDSLDEEETARLMQQTTSSSTTGSSAAHHPHASNSLMDSV